MVDVPTAPRTTCATLTKASRTLRPPPPPPRHADEDEDEKRRLRREQNRLAGERMRRRKHAEREDLEKSVSQKLAQFVDLEGRLAAQQAAIARLERFHRYGDVALALEAMIVRVARGDGGDAAPDAKRRRVAK